MCLSCGYYNGRQVIDLTAEKAKRDARIKAKEEKIKNELGVVAPTPSLETTEAVVEPKAEKKTKQKKSEKSK